jgi:hypothetical protein
MTAFRAMAVFHDNGEKVEVEHPTEQQLLDKLAQRDAELASWRKHHASLGRALAWSASLNLTLILWVVLR